MTLLQNMGPLIKIICALLLVALACAFPLVKTFIPLLGGKQGADMAYKLSRNWAGLAVALSGSYAYAPSTAGAVGLFGSLAIALLFSIVSQLAVSGNGSDDSKS